jgi:membrane protease YdiL (CAAX protease family)
MDLQPPVPINPEQNPLVGVDEVPWGAREAWFGVGFLGIWIGLSLAVSFLLANIQQEMINNLAVILLEVALFIPIWWFVFRRHRAGWKELGFRSFTWKDLGISCGLLVGTYVFMFVYGIVLSVFHIEPDVNWVEIFENQASPGWLIFTVVIVAPFLEEILFRGFIFTGFRNKYGWVNAMLISGALFAVNHLQLVGLITYFLLGCVLAYLRHASKSLWPSIFVHMVINSVSTGLVYILSTLTTM